VVVETLAAPVPDPGAAPPPGVGSPSPEHPAPTTPTRTATTAITEPRPHPREPPRPHAREPPRPHPRAGGGRPRPSSTRSCCGPGCGALTRQAVIREVAGPEVAGRKMAGREVAAGREAATREATRPIRRFTLVPPASADVGGDHHWTFGTRAPRASRSGAGSPGHPRDPAALDPPGSTPGSPTGPGTPPAPDPPGPLPSPPVGERSPTGNGVRQVVHRPLCGALPGWSTAPLGDEPPDDETPQPSHRGAGLLPLRRSGRPAAGRPGPGGRVSLAGGGGVPGRQGGCAGWTSIRSAAGTHGIGG
jgi:translation initiation factor IF-2